MIEPLKTGRANRVKRHIEISLLCGISITFVLTTLSALAIRWFPYRDLPMMPKPFFMYALLPGAMFAELFSSYRWIALAAFVVGNSVAYGLPVFFVIEFVGAVKRAERDSGP